jgi:hypothetical protein
MTIEEKLAALARSGLKLKEPFGVQPSNEPKN